MSPCPRRGDAFAWREARARDGREPIVRLRARRRVEHAAAERADLGLRPVLEVVVLHGAHEVVRHEVEQLVAVARAREVVARADRKVGAHTRDVAVEARVELRKTVGHGVGARGPAADARVRERRGDDAVVPQKSALAVTGADDANAPYTSAVADPHPGGELPGIAPAERDPARAGRNAQRARGEAHERRRVGERLLDAEQSELAVPPRGRRLAVEAMLDRELQGAPLSRELGHLAARRPRRALAAHREEHDRCRAVPEAVVDPVAHRKRR